MTTTKKKTTPKKKTTIRRSAASRALRRIFAQQDIEIDFVYRLLAFGALASGALNNDTQNQSIAGPALAKAAQALRSDPSKFTANGKTYLTLLGFDADFANNIMPWNLISEPGINAMGDILEPDPLDYDDGGCFHAFQAALEAIKGIGS